MTNPREDVTHLLSAHGWEPPEIDASLDDAIALLDDAGHVGWRHADVLLRALRFVADPPMALGNVRRFLRAVPDPAATLEALAEDTEYRHLTVALFAFSQFLADIVINDPAWFATVLRSSTLDREMSAAEFRAALAAFLEAHGEDNRPALITFKRRQLLRIGVRELLDLAHAAELCRELSALAESIIDHVCARERSLLVARHGTPRDEDGSPAGFAIYAMGKLGSRELNFSSDIDVVFIYGDEGETTGVADMDGRAVRRLSNHEFFNVLADRVSIALGGPAGFDLYRVDTRLRPDGDAGPLARSVDSTFIYFERQGRIFEKVAWLRARFVAGDPAVARALDPFIEDFVFNDAHLDDAVREIALLKRRIDHEQLSTDERALDLKRGTGGIREIEFIVALHQLVAGASDRSLRWLGTIDALDALAASARFDPDEATRLRDAYYFFRRVEHTLQMMHEEQTASLPADRRRRAELALRCGRSDPAAFERELHDHRAFVRSRFEHYFHSVQPGTPVESLIDTLAAGREPAGPEMAILTDSGLDNRDAILALRDLVRGTRSYAPSALAQRRVEVLFPELIARTGPVPDRAGALRQLDRFFRAAKAVETLLDLLRERPRLLGLLLQVFGTSPAIARAFVARPEWLEFILAGEALFPANPPAHALGREVARGIDEATYRGRVELHLSLLALREIAGLVPSETAAADTSAAAAAVLRHMAAFAGADDVPIRWCLLGMGGLGEGEVHLHADLDLVCVAESASQPHDVESLLTRLLARLAEPGVAGPLWRTDTRLRPDGAKGPLVVPSQQRLLDYYRREAGLWEWLVLLKAAPVAGDLEWGRDLLVQLWMLWEHRRPPRATLVSELTAMRRRTEAAARPKTISHRVDLKRSPGGLWDIDFAVGCLMLSTDISPAERRRSGTHALDLLVQRGIISPPERDQMRAHRALLRTVQRTLRYMSEGTRDLLPPLGDEGRVALQRACLPQLKDRAAAIPEFEASMRAMRALYDTLLNR